MNDLDLYRLRTRNEATGVRVVCQYVREFWNCGWQEFESRNDEGIDGLIILWNKKRSTGARINVQVKCGDSYVSSITDEYIHLKLGSEENLNQHVEYWKRQTEPCILVFVNPFLKVINSAGVKVPKEDRLQPKAWWVDLKSVELRPSGAATIIAIPLINKFGQHSKADISKLVQFHFDKNRINNIPISAESLTFYRQNLNNLKSEALLFFKNWRDEGASLNGQPILISNLFWNHINSGERGLQRRSESLRLIPYLKQLINNATTFYRIEQTYDEDLKCVEEKWGVLGVTLINKVPHNVQAIIQRKNYLNNDDDDKWWLFSVHFRK